MNNQTPREILNKFYTENHLELDGGNSLSYVKIEAARGFSFYIPNFDSRRKAVIKHDIHHLLTGYKTTLKEESEISAWEIASGCRKYPAAFFINTSGIMLGILINFRGTLKAYARGRKTENLYSDKISVEQAMDMKIEELKKQFLLDEFEKDTKPSFKDFLLLAAFSIYGLIFSVLSIALLPFIILYSIYIAIIK